MSTVNSNSTAFVPFATGPSSAGAKESYSASEAQLEVWLSSGQSTEANCAYNEISSLVFVGNLNVDVLLQAFEKVVERHDSLRTTFSNDGQTAFVHSGLKHGLKKVDLSANNGAELSDALSAVIKTEANTPFDLENGPLVRVVLQKASDTTH